jgi:ubiquinone/menaquinone biosynthesis C-methylase UbiE
MAASLAAAGCASMFETTAADQLRSGTSFWRRDERRRWDRRVDVWEEVAASPAFRCLAATVFELAAPNARDRAVDLGAGSGLLSLAFAVETVVAVDHAPAMLERLRQKMHRSSIGNVECLVADLRSLPLADESATLVVSNYAFHHLADAQKALALAEARRVLEPGGRLVVCDMMFALSLDARDRALIARKLVRIVRRGPTGLVRIVKNAARIATRSWEHPASAERWRELLEGRRFADIEVRLLEHEAGVATARRPDRSAA